MTAEFVLRITLWGLGTCVTGFLFLMGIVWKLNTDLKDKIGSKWFEEHFKPEMKDDFNKIEKSLEKLSEAIIGTVDKKGIVHRLNDLENRDDAS